MDSARTVSIDRLLRVETNATLARPTRIIMLDAETAKNLHHSVIHAYGDGKLKLT